MTGPFRTVLSFMRAKGWLVPIFNYFDHRYTNAYVESLNGLINRLGRTGRGYDRPTLRAKALLKYGNVKRMDERYDFYPSGDAAEREAMMATAVSHGVDLSTWMADLEAKTF